MGGEPKNKNIYKKKEKLKIPVLKSLSTILAPEISFLPIVLFLKLWPPLAITSPLSLGKPLSQIPATLLCKHCFDFPVSLQAEYPHHALSKHFPNKHTSFPKRNFMTGVQTLYLHSYTQMSIHTCTRTRTHIQLGLSENTGRDRAVSSQEQCP